MEKTESNKRQSFFKTLLLFLSGTVASKIISFFCLPIYSSYISTEDMGSYDTSTTVLILLASVCYMELWSGMLRFFKEKNINKRLLLKGGFQFFIASTLVFSCVAVFICFLLDYKYKVLLTIETIFSMFSSYCGFCSRGLGHNKSYAISGTVASVINIFLNCLLLIYFKLDYSALFYSSIVAYFVQCFYLFFRCKMYRCFADFFRLSPYLQDLFKFCAPLSLSSASYWCLTSLNKVIYNSMYGDSASGIFSLGSRFGSVVTIFTSCFTYAWQDIAFASASSKNAQGLYSYGFNLYLKFLTTGACLSLPLIKILYPYFISDTYSASERFIPLFIFISCLSGLFSFTSSIFYSIKKTKIELPVCVCGAAVNIIMVYPAVKFVGANGACLSSLFAYFILIMISSFYLNKKINMRFNVHFAVIAFAWASITYIVFVSFGSLANVCLFFVSLIAGLLVFKEILIGAINKRCKKRGDHDLSFHR